VPPILPTPPNSTLFPYTTLFRSDQPADACRSRPCGAVLRRHCGESIPELDTIEHVFDATYGNWVLTVENVCARMSVCLRSIATRSEEHTSELQSLRHLVCRLLLE